MRKDTSRWRAGAAVALGGMLATGMLSTANAKGPKVANILEFGSMVGVPDAMTGTKAPIRGINGGGIPWTIASGVGELKAGGHLEVAVNGLVLAAGPSAGSNPITAFRAIVSCLTSDNTIVNVTTAPFPATTGPAASGGGDAFIEADVVLPQPCIAPLIFVTSPGGAWFATVGN